MLLLGERIQIGDFVSGIKNLTFDDLTEEKLEEIFSDRELTSVDNEDSDTVTVLIDNYLFTLYRFKDYLPVGSYKLNDTIVLDDKVAVFLPCDYGDSEDIEGTGTLTVIQDLVNGEPWDFWSMTVEYKID